MIGMFAKSEVVGVYRFKKRVPLFVLTAVLIGSMFLSACGKPASATETPVSPNTPTVSETAPATPTISAPTATATETSAVNTYDRPLEIISTDLVTNIEVQFKLDEEIVRPTVNGLFKVDKTAEKQSRLQEVSVPDSLGGKLLFQVAAWLDWFHGNNPHTGANPTDKDLAEFATRLEKVQSGKESCATVQSTIFAFDAQVPGDRMTEMKVALFCGGGDVPEGVRRIDNVEIVYVSGYTWNLNKSALITRPDMPRFTVTASNGGYGFESEVDGTTLRLKVGLDFLTVPTNVDRKTAKYTAFLLRWLAINNGQPNQKMKAGDAYVNVGDGYILQGFSAK